jgi:PST family polysaccharide transporter
MLHVKNISQNTKKALNNVNWLLLEKMISMPVTLLISFIIARYLGPEAFGEYNYILAIVALVTPLSVMGLSGLVSRELINNPDKEQAVMGASIVGRLLGVLMSTIILIIAAFTLEVTNHYWIIIIAVAQTLSFCSVIDFWLQAKLHAKMSVAVRVTVLITVSIGKLVIVWKDLGLSLLVYLYAFEFMLQAIGYLIVYVYKGGSVRLAYSKTYLYELLSQSKWLILSGVAAVIYLKIDIVMLKHLVNESEVGIYSVASRISETWYFIPTIIVTSFFPSLLEARKKGRDLYVRRMQKLNDILLLLSTVIVIIILVLAEFLITLLYGQEYSAATPILQIHIFAGIFIFMRALLSKWLIIEHLLKYSLVTQASGAILNVLLNFLLIPAYHGVGAAFATLISYAAASYFALFLSKDTRPMASIMTYSLFFPLRWFR